ncbi:MAG TPA: indole-3-glycerol phosphate synthase TrpC, partial [Chitinophagaceae bacterium]|nr:indole-3-glycerol phosphate synthase TrpC [Chitinophagaceae bacterium]
ADSTGIIAEFKRKSPSKGWFKNAAIAVEDIVPYYEQYGAAALSVLTDEEFFGGTKDDLLRARSLTRIPVLRKDFMIDEWQIAEARTLNADVILLIAACLSPAKVKRMAAYAKSIGLEVLLELHDEKELAHICDETDIIGINNRNLKTFEVDVERSLRMAEKIPADKVKVAESGINSVENISLFREHGFKGFLIGEHFMKEADTAAAFKQFTASLQPVK